MASRARSICTAKIVESVPWIDAKYYAATQVMDEARHVEVFAKYLDTKLSGHYPINAHLRLLLDDIIGDKRWDMTYLGMQIMVEGLALAAFGFIHMLTTEPLLKQLLRYVMADEARHVAFGVLSLKEYYEELDDDEIRERQEFAFEAAVRMRDRFLQQEVWDRMGIDAKTIVPLVAQAPDRQAFQMMLFSKIVPNCKKLGLLDAGDAWLRQKFTELGVIQFEDWVDTSVEYENLDEVNKDRAVASSRPSPLQPEGVRGFFDDLVAERFGVAEGMHGAHLTLQLLEVGAQLLAQNADLLGQQRRGHLLPAVGAGRGRLGPVVARRQVDVGEAPAEAVSRELRQRNGDLAR